MKLFSTIVVSSCLAAQAFGVTPVVSKTKGLSKPALVTHKSPLRQKNAADVSPLFRDPTVTRGGAIPGLDAYSEALETKPIMTKALTSLVGWFLGDLLAQVCGDINSDHIVFPIKHLLYMLCEITDISQLLPFFSSQSLPSALHCWWTRRLQTPRHPLLLRIHLPWPLGTLLLQLAG